MTQLEMHHKTAAALGWPELLAQLASLCHTSRGQELARQLPLQPTLEAADAELQRVSEARALHDRAEPLPFGEIWDLRPALRRLEKGAALEAAELLQVAQTLRSTSRLRRFLRDRAEDVPALAQQAAGLAELRDVADVILGSFEEGGRLSDRASGELASLRRQVLELHDQLTRRMRELMEDPLISKFLQDTFYTQREERYVLPIRSDSGSAVEGIVHGSSSSGASLFIEPKQVVVLNNQLKVAEIAVAREEARILGELSAMVADERPAIGRSLELLQALDVVDARARLAIELQAHRPRLTSDGQLTLQAMRHPLMVLAGSRVVANDLELGDAQTLIITGPNAGGKTVCLKTLGLCVLMARAGMQLPVGPDSALGFFPQVLAEMGDDQSIEQNLSTFTAHLTHLQRFLSLAGPGTLVLLDEIGVGTDPGEGAALAQALLEALVATRAQVVVTTHYERLKALPVADPRFVNASVGYDLSKLSPTFELHLGLPGSSGALAVARRLGLQAEVVDRATSLLDSGGEGIAALLTALAGERTRLQQEQQRLSEAQAAAAAQEARWRQTIAELQLKGLKEIKSVHAAALEELKRARQELERVRALLKRAPSKERLQQADRQISQAAAALRRHEPRPAPQGRAAAAEELTPGTTVLVESLGGRGEILEAPIRGKVALRVGGIRAQVPLEEILIPPGHAPPKTRASSPQQHSTPAAPPPPAPPAPALPGASPDSSRRQSPVRTDAITLDLRGMRVHEALAETERFLDRALRSGEPALFIIHGHGTGALKSALRQELQASALIEHLQPGDSREGGDGVTVVWLRA